VARIVANDEAGWRMLAFLDMLAVSEIGKPLLAVSDDGYNVIVGSTHRKPHLFASYSDHPQVFVTLSPTLRSSAAGRYQFLARTWDALAREHGYTDFSPENQDRGALQLVRERKALDYVRRGSVVKAIELCAPIWASLPGAGYGQHEHKLETLISAYQESLAAYQPDFSNVVSGVTTTAPKE
jgi:muramidase (phage lysozyme)